MKSATLPTAEQTWLLRACLQSGQAGAEAWKAWLEHIGGPDRILGPATRGVRWLFPLLSTALRHNKVSIKHRVFAGLRAAYLAEEIRNKTYWSVFRDVLSRLAQHNLPTIVLRGAALAQTVYPDPAMRHCHDVDLLLRPQDLSQAQNLLLSAGFVKSRGDPLHGHQHLVFRHRSHLPLELHSRPFLLPHYSIGTSEVWERVREQNIAGASTLILCPTDQLLHIAVHAFCCQSRSSLRWVCDAWFLLQGRPHFDWTEVLDRACSHSVALPVLTMLDYLAQEIGAPIPDPFLNQLRAASSEGPSLSDYLRNTEENARKLELQRPTEHFLNRPRVKRLLESYPLGLLCRLDAIPAAHSVFKRVYMGVVYLVTGVLKRVEGVDCIYLRRGLAKAQFLPFFSDIDLTIIVADNRTRQRVQTILKRLHLIFPFLDRTSQITPSAEFSSHTDPRNLAENRLTLYRMLEAKSTWRLLYSGNNDSILDGLQPLEKRQVVACVLSEIFYWHHLVIRHYTDYRRFRADRKLNLFQQKRLCWLFMKATNELTNLLNGLSEADPLLFDHRSIIQTTLRRGENDRWIRLFRDNEAILENRFDWSRAKPFVAESFAYVSELYRHFFDVLRTLFEQDEEFVRWSQQSCFLPRREYLLGFHSVDLARLASIDPTPNKGLSAIFLATRAIGNIDDAKVLLILVEESLDAAPLEAIRNCIEQIQEQLRSQQVKPSEIQVNLVDRFGFLCFGAPKGEGAEVKCLFQRYAAYTPSLYSLLVNPVHPRRIQQIIRGFSTI